MTLIISCKVDSAGSIQDVEAANKMKQCLEISPSLVVGPSDMIGRDDIEFDPCNSPILREVMALDDRNSMLYSPFRGGLNYTRHGGMALDVSGVLNNGSMAVDAVKVLNNEEWQLMLVLS